MSDKIRYMMNQRDWYRNIGNYCHHYIHISETILEISHMGNKCRMDRICEYPKVWRGI